MNGRVMFSSDKNFWETPQRLFDELDAEFHFTLDVAASDENHKCARYFRRNGVLQSAIRKQRNGAVDGEVLPGGTEDRDNGGASDPCPDRPCQLSRLYSGQGRDPLPAW